MDITKRFLLDNQSLSLATKKTYLGVLRAIKASNGKSLEKNTEEDCKVYLATIANANTWNKHHIVLQKFYRWATGDDKFLKMKKRKQTPEEEAAYANKILAFTEQHLTWLRESAQLLRDRALVAVLFELGTRCGELLSAKLGGVKFDANGVHITVTGKTGMRTVLGKFCVADLVAWVNAHPLKGNPNAPLWCVLQGRDPSKPSRGRKWKGKRRKKISPGDPLQPRAVRSILGRALRTARKEHPEIPHVFPHLGRHFSATASSRAGMSTQAMKLRFGWKTNAMVDRYSHLTGADADEQYLKSIGAKSEVVNKKPSDCPRCHATNANGTAFCAACGSPMSMEQALAIDSKIEKGNDIDAAIQKEVAKRVAELLRDPKALRALASASTEK